MTMKQATECVGRPALILTNCTVADCPLECVCISYLEQSGKKVICDHYHGSKTSEKGSLIECGFTGR